MYLWVPEAMTYFGSTFTLIICIPYLCQGWWWLSLSRQRTEHKHWWQNSALIWFIWPIKCFPHLENHTQQNRNSLAGSVLLWRQSGIYLLLQHALRGLHNLSHIGKYCFLFFFNYFIFSYFKSSYGIIGIAAPTLIPTSFLFCPLFGLGKSRQW